ncbi:hypothetical protein C8Q75DRAFT_502787 [Abortiporus biennis]|nr:hypothetical protein C8Q75DRAFT_502787 [Abortiporus biennis]
MLDMQSPFQQQPDGVRPLTEPSKFQLSPRQTGLVLFILKPHLDRQTILLASEVCREWRMNILPMIFRRLYIQIASKGFSAFCHFLDTTPGIGQFITSLEINGRASKGDDYSFQSLSLDDLRCMLSKLPILHRFALSEIVCDVPDSEMSNGTFPTTDSSVEFLDLSRDFVSRNDSVAPILSLFPNLHTLELGPLLDRVFFTDDAALKIPNLQLHTIKLLRPSPAVAEMIKNSSSSFRQHLRAIDFTEQSHSKELIPIINLLSKQLTHLGFVMDNMDFIQNSLFFYSAPDTWRNLGLVECTSLQSLRITVNPLFYNPTIILLKNS